MRRTTADGVGWAPEAPGTIEPMARSLEERRPRLPVELRRPAERTPGTTAAKASRTATRTDDDPTRALCCIGCGHTVTHERSMIEVAGRHAHSCVNPAGITYRIGCFREAPGVVGVGSWSTFFTWFADHAWQVACCSSCSMHLGWAFEPEREPLPERRFYGLIRNRLRDGAPRETGS